MNRVCIILAAVSLAGCLSKGASNQTGELRILSPAPGTIVHRGEQVDIVARTPGRGESAVFLAPEGAVPLLIARGDLRESETTEVLRAAWQVGETAPGSYTIRITSGDRIAAVPIEVRARPNVAIRLVEVDRRDGGIIAQFQAEIASVSPAVGYWWTVEDTTIADSTGRLNWTFRGSDRRTSVSVAARAEDGGIGSDVLTFDIAFDPPLPPLRPQAQQIPLPCGCASMAVNTQNVSEVYCLPGQQPPANLSFCRPANAQEQQQAQQRGVGCAQGANMFVCPLGVSVPPGGNNNRLGFGFEVVADLIHPSVPAQCTEGQLVGQTTIIVPPGAPLANPRVKAEPVPGQPITLPKAAPPPRVVTPVGNPQNPPRVPDYWAQNFQQGTDYGGDDYTTPGTNKIHEPNNRIRWFDFPSENTAPANQPALNRVLAAYRFLTFVLGNTGDCWCEFDIQYQWDRGANPPVTIPPQPPLGAPARPAIVRELDGFNCQVR